MSEDLPESFIKLLMSVEAKRPKTVIRHILQHGFITNEDLRDLYGYNHPPRAIRDVRELGIPIITYRVTDSTGRNIAAYKFGNPHEINSLSTKTRGRSPLSHKLKQQLIEKQGSKCFICLVELEARELQVDHRIPYEIGGEQDSNDPTRFMLVSASANRMKSWTCEHCMNWKNKDVAVCQGCFWAFPEDYEHVAGRKERVITITFTGDEVKDFNALQECYGTMEKIQQAIRIMIHEHIRHTDGS